MNSVAARKSARPLYAVFLERVIKIEAVQCHRAAVTDDDTAREFFDAGRRPGASGDFLWSLDAPEDVSLGAAPGAPFDSGIRESHFAPYATGVGRGGRGL